MTFWSDFRYGLRLLSKSPGFTAVAVLSLALGIGANTAIFSVVYSLLVRPLPYKDPGRLVTLWGSKLHEGSRRLDSSGPDFEDWKKQSQSFQDIAFFFDMVFTLTGQGEPERLLGQETTPNFFELLGGGARLGRTFSKEENVAVLSHRLWQRRFGANPNIVGRAVTFNDRSYTVIGVMPAGFRFMNREAELWTPTAAGYKDALRLRWNHFLSVIARVKPGVTLEQAQAEMDTIARRLEEQYPASNTGLRVRLVPLVEEYYGQLRPALLVLFGAVGLVLLIACANVANLLVARASARGREIAIRVALGAGRARLVRQLLTESLLLAFAGGALGLILGVWGTDLLAALIPTRVTIPLPPSMIAPSAALLGFTLGISLLTGILFGLAPALQASKADLHEWLKARTSPQARVWSAVNTRNVLVVAQVSLSLVLLAGAGLLVKSFLRLTRVDLGFRPENLLTMRTYYPIEDMRGKGGLVVSFYEQALERIKALPGVKSAGAINRIPLTSSNAVNFFIEGGPVAPGREPVAHYRFVSPGYFATMGIPLRAGRHFTDQDRRDFSKPFSAASPVAVVNETMARTFFAGEDPIGRRIRFGSVASPGTAHTVVGVVGDVRHFGRDTDPKPEVYVSLLQAPEPNMDLVVRTASDPAKLEAAIRRELWALDKNLPIHNVRTVEQVVGDSVWQRRLNMLLMGTFGVAALLLAAMGIYGVVAVSVTQRTHEIGIRIALGAQVQDVLTLVVGHGMALVLIGVGIGLAAAFALTRAMARLLYGVSATDPAVFAAVALLLATVALLACYLPARRAANVDPTVALRYE